MSTNIEVSCTTCGTVNRIGEADVPAGARFVPCVSCKSRVALPPMKASRNTPPPLPSIPSRGAGSAIGLADLPAPKRQSPLGNEPSRPAPKSALSEIELPAPKGGRQPSAPVTSAGSFDLDDLMPDSAELPAPKGGRAPDVADLPVPRGAAPPVKSRAMTDLPMAMPDVSDLPAPAAVKASAARTPPAMPSVSDLPAPKARNIAAVSDLPAPVARGPAISDLPSPRNAGGIVDLPAPKATGGIVDLPTPRTDSDVPAPKGFFDDLPQPARAGSPTRNPDLPAPKGFFDDLPGKVSSNKPEVPAPKGFFDDLPGRVNSQKAAQAAQPEVPAPKGFFDDLPGRQNQSNAPQPPAPKGFFDDLPQPSSTQTAPPQPSLSQSAPPKPAGKPVNTPVELNMDSSASLDLGLAPSSESSQARRFDDLDLSAPSTGIKFDSPKAAPAAVDEARARTPSVQPLPAFKKDKGQPATLELEEPRDVPMQSAKLAPRRKSEPSIDPDAARAKARRVRVIALAGLFLVALGAGGFYFYRKWAAKRAVESTITEELAAAKDALRKSDRAHWDRAAGAAQRVIEANPKHAEALAIAAEARLASALADGQNYGGKLAQARANIQTAVSENIAGPNLIKAQALNAITQSIGERALELLKPMASDPKDAQLQLYLGWGYAVAADPANAIKAFDAAEANGTDFIKLCALYGRANAKLDQADLEGATADYKAVLALDKDHIGAQVGIAAAMPASQSQQQEKDLLALFERKDFATGDPRAVVKAWSLAAEAAKRGGRLDAARERYRNALNIMGDDLGALAGAADVELRDGKLDAAADQIAKALAISKDDIRSQLVQSEISIAKGELADARARITALANRNPPPPKLDQSRIKLAAGHLAEKESKDEEAAALYAEAAELAGEADLTPTLAAVAKYTALADKADDQTKAEELRGKATKLLENLEAQAEKDPAIALALGSAYLRTGDATKAEPWLRKFIDARPDDADGQFQIAKALAKLDKTEEAITRLGRAIELAPKRLEFQIDLARTYELAKQDDKAAGIYNKLLADNPDPSVEIRAGAGRFFARRGEKEKAGEQGEAILKVVPNHTAGLFLKAEGLLAKNQLDEARILFGKAAAAERDAQYFDGLGRANEAKAVASNEVKFIQFAIDAYKTATTIDAKMFDSFAGMGRMYMLRKEPELAIAPLRAANAIDPKEPNVIFLVGKAFFLRKDIDPGNGPNAMGWLKSTLALKQNPEASYYLGVLYGDANQMKPAADALGTATRLGIAEEKSGNELPWMRDALYRLGDIQKGLNNYDAAREAWILWLGRSPAPGVKVDNVRRELATTLKPR